ncbi:MAG: serine protease [Myxococcales bacterium]|nr:serine protease [Myxococcales bacterium]
MASLPSVNVSQLDYASDAARHLQAHGLDTEALFERLEHHFPAQRNVVAAARLEYIGDQSSVRDAAPPRTGDLEPLPEETRLRLVGDQERVMGERPTFLDVYFLTQGVERARGVFKVDAELLNPATEKWEWYSGTAFLVTPDTVVTAHHNLWFDAERARAVRVIMDYERVAPQRQRAATSVDIDVQTLRGDRAHDWAVLTLPTPCEDRRVVPLSTAAATQGDRVSIIQHPDGDPKQIALHHNLVTSVDADRLQYLTDTRSGSSGSPVFDDAWNVVGVHHQGGMLRDLASGRRVYRNQGTTVECLRRGLDALGIDYTLG